MCLFVENCIDLHILFASSPSLEASVIPVSNIFLSYSSLWPGKQFSGGDYGDAGGGEYD